MPRIDTPGGRADTRRWLLASTVTAVYAAVVITASVYHEPWRDEVVPLSIVRSASSWAEFTGPLKYEGHPILWYVVLRAAWAIVGNTWVLKAVGVAAAVGAVLLFMLSPLPWWLRCLFTFSFFPLYQYSVISRGYGLEMLLLFAFCALHPYRRERPLALALVLAALANTEALGAILAIAAVASLVFEHVWRGEVWLPCLRDRRLVVAAAVFAAGLAFAVVVASPPPSHRWGSLHELDLAKAVAGIAQAILQPAGYAALFPFFFFFLPWPSVWVWGYFLYLTRRPAVLCFCALAVIGMQTFFRLIYAPAPWHIGSLVLAIVAAMWLDASASTPRWELSPRLERVRSWLGRTLAAGFTVLLAGHVLFGVMQVHGDIARDYSQNRRLAELLHTNPALAGAVVIGEPDAPVTSLPYYAANSIYLPREGVYRWWLTWAPPRRAAYDLDALLAAAREVRAQTRRPVVIALGYDLKETGVQTRHPGSRYEETFTIAPESRDQFRAATRLLAQLTGPTLTDERYDVYVLR